MLRLKSAWRGATTHIKMSAQEFMQHLAALVPRPRLHLIRFHGVLAPNAARRAAIVPGLHGRILACPRTNTTGTTRRRA